MNACEGCGDRVDFSGERYCFTCRRTTDHIPLAQFDAMCERERLARELDEAQCIERRKIAACTRESLRSMLHVNVIADTIKHPTMDWSTGEAYTSKAKRKQDYDAAGMFMISGDELYRHRPTPMPRHSQVRTSRGTLLK